MPLSHRFALLSLAVSAALGITPRAFCQDVFRAQVGADGVPATTQGFVRPVAAPPAQIGVQPVGAFGVAPFWPAPWGAGGYLTGVANVYNAQGQYQVSSAQARILDQQARQAKLDTQRRIFDERRYERAMTPTLEDVREQQQYTELRRSRNFPSQGDIRSGRALNSLMDSINRTQAQLGVRGPTIPLSQDNVRQLNVSSGTTSGSASLIGQDRPLDWPLSLQRDQFEKPRDIIDASLPKAVDVVRQGGNRNPDLIKVLDGIKSMRILLDKEIDNMSADDYITGTRFVNQLSDAVRILSAPGAQNYFNGNWVARGNTVDQLLYNMSQQGLRFAPAAPGGEPAYTAVYNAVLDYDLGLQQIGGRR
jgi:hypothetical protein